MLGAAALLGRVVPPALLTAVTDQPDGTVPAALDAASRARLLVEEGRSYQFAHDLIREVVEADVGTARRLALHRRIAEALEQQAGEPPVERLAYHYARSEERDRAAHYLEQAGDRAAAQGAQAAAEGYYREAVEYLDGLGRGADAARTREKLGAVLTRAGQYEAAQAILGDAARVYRALADTSSLLRTTALLAELYAERGHAEVGLACVRPVVEPFLAGAADAGLHYELATAVSALANQYFLLGRFQEHLTMARRATELARLSGNASVLAKALEQTGQALLMLVGRRAEVEAVIAEACAVAEATRNDNALFYALLDGEQLCRATGQLARRREYLARACLLAEQLGDAQQLVACSLLHGNLSFDTGQWSQARAEWDDALSQARRMEGN